MQINIMMDMFRVVKGSSDMHGCSQNLECIQEILFLRDGAEKLEKIIFKKETFLFVLENTSCYLMDGHLVKIIGELSSEGREELLELKFHIHITKNSTLNVIFLAKSQNLVIIINSYYKQNDLIAFKLNKLLYLR